MDPYKNVASFLEPNRTVLYTSSSPTMPANSPDASPEACKSLPAMEPETYFRTFIIPHLAQLSSPTSKPHQTPKVFGIGPSRSGTLSLANAFNRIGMGPCSWGMTFNSSAAHCAFALRAMDTSDTYGSTGVLDSEIHTMLDGWGAHVDSPIPFIWRSLVRVYPEAKFVLVTRDADKWWASLEGLESVLGGWGGALGAWLDGDNVRQRGTSLVRTILRTTRRQVGGGEGKEWMAGQIKGKTFNCFQMRMLIVARCSGQRRYSF